jgi:hypothetical protein
MKESAHKALIDRCLSWNLVKERLSRYKNIGKFYKLEKLQSCSNKSPYYCHYMSWRLGTWKSEEQFEFLDTLLGNAAQLPNWSIQRIPQGCEFENFWSFMWELQIAQFFTNQPNTIVEWTKSGPDLKINSSTNLFFVECTIYRKSFGLEEFINELLSHIHPRIKAKHIPFNIFSLPKGQSIDSFLDKLFRPLLDETYLEEKIREVEKISPVILSTPKDIKNLYVFIESDTAKEFNPDQPWTSTGQPEGFLDIVVKEVLDNKRTSNELKLHRPNLLAVNLLLGVDFQLARALDSTIADPRLGTEYDALLLTTCGIDKIPLLNGFLQFDDTHPIKSYLKL